MPEELWTEVHDIVQEAAIKTIPNKKKCKKAKWFSEEALKIPEKIRDVKGKKRKRSKWMKNTGHSSKTGFQLLTACFYRHLADARFKLQICRPEGHESREQGTYPAWVRPSLPL